VVTIIGTSDESFALAARAAFEEAAKKPLWDYWRGSRLDELWRQG
jgi:hypothetical protein